MSSFTVRYCPDVDPQHVVQRVIRNPNYGGSPCVVPGTCRIPLRERDIKPKFFVALKANVSKSGFRNPVLLYDTPDGLLLSFGGSRLRVAKELDKKIPAIVVDYTGIYALFREVTEHNWPSFFTDVPVLFEFTDYGIDTHYSLERNRREFYDKAGIRWTKGLDDTDFLDEEFEWLADYRT